MRSRQGSRGAQVATSPQAQASSVAGRIRFTLSAVAVLIADQVTKWLAVTYVEPGEVEVIPGVLRLYVTRNTGGIFGVLQGAGLIFFVLTAAVMAVLVVGAWRSGFHPALTGAIAGGGLGNLADRVFRTGGGALFEGGVVDFIDLSFWPSFNMADSVISIGVLLLVVRGFLYERLES
ncbi:MAG: signal peptidase II [Acidimicrobiia bacterium]